MIINLNQMEKTDYALVTSQGCVSQLFENPDKARAYKDRLGVDWKVVRIITRYEVVA